MASNQTLLCLAMVVIVLGAFYYVYHHTSREEHEGYDYHRRDLPTSPEVESIQGEPDFDVVDSDGMELIHPGDIALGAGYGIGEGTVGFGRYGSSFMA